MQCSKYDVSNGSLFEGSIICLGVLPWTPLLGSCEKGSGNVMWSFYKKVMLEGMYSPG